MAASRPPLTIAFESAQLSYSDLEVDLYNSGVNQILSVAAARGHGIYHFSLANLYRERARPMARATRLELPEDFHGDPLEAYRVLSPRGQEPLELEAVDLTFLRGDDIRHEGTSNLDILRELEGFATVIERVDTTLETCDKYELVRRCPDLPQPVTFATSNLAAAKDAIAALPRSSGYFVLKDRYGYGCGKQVHRLEFDDPELESRVNMYLQTYEHLVLQEYRPEVQEGDIVAIFLDGRLLGALRRNAAWGEWKTNASLGGTERAYALDHEQERIARAAQNAFSDCRLISVDMLTSGRVLEVNAFPGANGLWNAYRIALGEQVMDRLEAEITGMERPGIATARRQAVHPAGRGSYWDDVYQLYDGMTSPVEVLDILDGDTRELPVNKLIEFVPLTTDAIVSIPHAGTYLPTRHAERFSLDARALVEIDLYSDFIFSDLAGMQVISRLAPFFIDMNRNREGSEAGRTPPHLRNTPEDYIDIEGKSMLQRKYDAPTRREVLRYYDLYHRILEVLIDRMRRERGYALVIDGHSMTSVGLKASADKGEARADFVLGTLDDRSADPAIIDAFAETLKAEAQPHGLTVAKNAPYSGGFITRRHAARPENTHVLQLEISMDAYMFEATEPDAAMRYLLRPARVRLVRDIVRAAIAAAAAESERLYGPSATRGAMA